jgi:hypothetical protein
VSEPEHDPVSLTAATKIVEPRSRLSNAIRDRSFATHGAVRHRCTQPYGILHHGAVPYRKAVSLIARTSERAIANMDFARNFGGAPSWNIRRD